MILHNVNRNAIDRVINNLAQATGQGQYELADVAIALAEYMGRLIVATCDTPISGVQLASVMEDHIKRTLHAGYTAKGYNMGQGDLPV